jgi:hypothetical protein
MDVTRLGEHGLHGWKGRVAETVADRADRARIPLTGPQVRAIFGLGFFAMSLLYVLKTLRGLAREARG